MKDLLDVIGGYGSGKEVSFDSLVAIYGRTKVDSLEQELKQLLDSGQIIEVVKDDVRWFTLVK